MTSPDFCRECGTQLKAGSQFCPSCGKVVTVVAGTASTRQYASPGPSKRSVFGGRQTIWGIDKRYIVAGIFLLILIAPIFPRQKVVQVTEYEMVTTTLMSTSYATSYVTQIASQGQVSIKVYVGYVQSWTGQQIVDGSQHIIRVDYVNEATGTRTVTLTSYEGQQTVIRNVFNSDLTLTGTATVQGNGQSIVSPVETPTVTPYPSVQQQQVTRSQVITEHVSILQMLLGY